MIAITASTTAVACASDKVPQSAFTVFAKSSATFRVSSCRHYRDTGYSPRRMPADRFAPAVNDSRQFISMEKTRNE